MQTDREGFGAESRSREPGLAARPDPTGFNPSRMADIIADEVAEDCCYRRSSRDRERMREGARKGALIAFKLIEKAQ